jgi:hypothetical protein
MTLFLQHKPTDLRMFVMVRNFCLTAALAGSLILGGTGASLAQQAYPTPEAAEKDLVDSARSNADGFVQRIFGPYGKALLESGGAAEDSRRLKEFNERASKGTTLIPKSDDTKLLQLSTNGWVFPIPIVKRDNSWSFDPAAGKTEIENRLIGHNELSAIAACRAYVQAQEEYHHIDRNQDELREFAQKIISSPGARDGLYWPPQNQADISPLDGLISDANLGKRQQSSPEPYNGYFFKILKAQGPAAPGGAFSYVINGHMIAGYALVAYPAVWGKSGIKSFICGQNGKVYERDLGARSTSIGAAMSRFDPDANWSPVE